MEARKGWLRPAAGSFRFRLIATSVICLLIPTLITLAVTNVLTRDAVREQAVENAEEQLELIDGYLSGLFQNMLNISNYIMVDPDMNVILKEQAAGKEYTGEDAEYREFADRYAITSKIDNISIIGERTYVTILLPNGEFFINYPLDEYDPRRLFEEPWFPELDGLAGTETYWVEAKPSPYAYEKTAGRQQISVARTLRRPNQKAYAYVVVTVPDKQIDSIFRRLAQGQEIMLVDGNNRVMSHLDDGRIGETLPYLNESTGRSSIVELGGERYLVARHAVGIKDWELVLLTPYRDAVYRINHIFQTVFVFQGIAFAAFLVLLVLLIRAFTKPLVRLGKVALTVERGNLEVRSGMRGRDEIGRLGRQFDQMLDRVKQMIADITAEQSRKRKAELKMLQAQIQPHFLFNVLNSIRMKVLRKGDKESAEMLSSLSRLLRMTIDRDEETIALHEEVSTAIDYVKLMNMRQKEGVTLSVDVSSEAMLAQVPRFFLQPVIENALIHGFQQRSGTIALKVGTEGRTLRIAVRDDGEGMRPEALDRLRNKLKGRGDMPEEREPRSGFSGIGLVNVNERMRMMFGEAFELHIDSVEGGGTTVTMCVPL